MKGFPEDDNKRITGAVGRQMVHGAFSMERWEYHEITGVDRGTDCEFELVENGQFTNKKIHGQVKGTYHIENYETTDVNTYSFPLEIKIINYALNCSEAFVLFLADAVSSKVYYLAIQDYFIENPKEYIRLKKNKSTVTLHIPKNNIVTNDDFELQHIAKSVYLVGESGVVTKF